MDKTVALCTMEKFDNRMPNSVGSSRIRMRWMLPYWEQAEEFIITHYVVQYNKNDNTNYNEFILYQDGSGQKINKVIDY